MGSRSGSAARDRGAALVEIQALLAENGIERSISDVESMLRSRMYLGEIHFGELHNTRARADHQGARTRVAQAADPRGGRADRTRQRGSLMTRSGSSASLDCWADTPARRPWRLTKTLDDAHTARARLGDRGESNVIGPDEIDKLRESACEQPSLVLLVPRRRLGHPS